MPNVKPENQKTRPDLNDQAFVVWLSQQPENKGVPVPELYRKMLTWCTMKGKPATRLRLLNWIASERESMPMTYIPENFDPALGTDTCPECNGTQHIRVNDYPNVPCPKCRPRDEKAFWKSRGK